MPIPEEYLGREQSLAKHLLLEDYLKKLAYHILFGWSELVYIDGFSGPWKSNKEDLSDTSFAKALKILSEVQTDTQERFGKKKKVRCLFIEKEKESFLKLQSYINENQYPEIEAVALHGRFENLIEEVQRFIGSSFAFIFIDPTGWKGYSYEKIKPLFQQKAEILINFMFNDINRFIEWDAPSNKTDFNDLLGCSNWEEDLNALYKKYGRREPAILELYCNRLKKLSDKINWATTYMPISHPIQDRSWFYLIYATTHPKGLQVFHATEETVLDRYGEIRKEILHDAKKAKTGQQMLFDHAIETPSTMPLSSLRQESFANAQKRILEILKKCGSIEYDQLAFEILQMPLVTDKTLKQWLKDMEEENLLTRVGLTNRQQPKSHTIIQINNN